MTLPHTAPAPALPRVGHDIAGWDVIGDVHGQADKLHALLVALGYTRRGERWTHAERKAAFVGDLIDRGPRQVAVFETVRAMVDDAAAVAITGNHEFNARGWVTPNPRAPGEFLRRHSAGNHRHHAAFLEQVGDGSARHAQMLAWFATLPVHLDLGGARLVHAWWHPAHRVDAAPVLDARGAIRDDALAEAFDKDGSTAGRAIDGLLKGLEVRLPPGIGFLDGAGVRRTGVRVRWWDDTLRSFRAAALGVDDSDLDHVPDAPLPPGTLPGLRSDVPVFIGHYWWRGTPAPLGPRIACVDFSAGTTGPLTAYRWDGESTLRADRFVQAGAAD
ncbi:MAG: metallophosphoesterase [Burkholderiales bacterium]|jgi:hypothetical protein|nr:metallophosphoesterase [Burkholderiales bacterium]